MKVLQKRETIAILRGHVAEVATPWCTGRREDALHLGRVLTLSHDPSTTHLISALARGADDEDSHDGVTLAATGGREGGVKLWRFDPAAAAAETAPPAVPDPRQVAEAGGVIPGAEELELLGYAMHDDVVSAVAVDAGGKAWCPGLSTFENCECTFENGECV